MKAIRDERWIIVKDTYITYLHREKSPYIGYVLLIDNSFECVKKKKPGAIHGIQLKNKQRSLFLRCKSSYQQNEWFNKLTIDLNEKAKDFIQKNELRSYAPPRPNQMCRWYVNAAGYMVKFNFFKFDSMHIL